MSGEQRMFLSDAGNGFSAVRGYGLFMIHEASSQLWSLKISSV